MPTSTIRIATRTSPLALWQAEYVSAQLRNAVPDRSVELVRIKSSGDTNQTSPLREFGGTGAFTREVQAAVLAGDADLAVHSLKDLPTESVEGLHLASVPERAPRLDAVLLPKDVSHFAQLSDLPAEARIGTGSPRRQAQLLHHRPDLKPLEIRGNVDTRIRKLDEGDFDAIILAEAGLRRLGLDHRISFLLAPPTMLPAVGQGALGIECRADDDETSKLLATLSDAATLDSVTAERSLLRALRAGCHAPLGVWSETDEDCLTLTGVLLSLDGQTRLEATATGDRGESEHIGRDVADQLLAAGGDQLVGVFS
jgi:hydroxymethylbilane synthase